MKSTCLRMLTNTERKELNFFFRRVKIVKQLVFFKTKISTRSLNFEHLHVIFPLEDCEEKINFFSSLVKIVKQFIILKFKKISSSLKIEHLHDVLPLEYCDLKDKFVFFFPVSKNSLKVHIFQIQKYL